jgi:hypothetical protein
MRVAISASALDDKPDGGSSFRLSVALMRLAQRVAAMPYSGAAQGWELLSTKIAASRRANTTNCGAKFLAQLVTAKFSSACPNGYGELTRRSPLEAGVFQRVRNGSSIFMSGAI